MTNAESLKIHQKLGKRYKIRNGRQWWYDLTDEERAMRVRKYAAHYLSLTGKAIIPVIQNADYRPPYAVSFLED